MAMNKKSFLYLLLILDIIAIIGIAGYIFVDLRKGPSVLAAAQKKVAESASRKVSDNTGTLTTLTQKTAPREPAHPQAATRKIRFQYRNSKPRQVSVMGEFNDWEHVTMVKGKNHTWSAIIEIKPGDYLYCYDVDGRLIPDPNNPNLRILSGKEKRSLLKVKPRNK